MKKAKKMRNFVAKHIKHCGAGQHKAKYGRFISRTRRKHLDNKGVQE